MRKTNVTKANVAQASHALQQRVASLNSFLEAMEVDISDAKVEHQPAVEARTIIELRLGGEAVDDANKRHVLRKTFSQIAKRAGVRATIERSKRHSNEVVAHIYI